ncbi:helix-turn-helix transcriptional regulator [Enhygromyxa salina]|uniref:helix-turn-helix transcriptional regulator n=1 Tax=Enhygromyxa salina TaxID=215803 RepID=UPI0011BA980A|nr:helix-turn-helix transcriptional regulator [Enhygromyxa salina]
MHCSHEIEAGAELEPDAEACGRQADADLERVTGVCDHQAGSELERMTEEPSQETDGARLERVAVDCSHETEAGAELERVDFRVASDESARRIEAVLGALGFEPVRDLAQIEGDLFEEIADVVARRYRLSSREHQALTLLLRGISREQIAVELRVSKPTLKWYLYNVYQKLDVHSSEEALRLALRIDGDPRWLRDPRRQREALELLETASVELLAATRGHSRERIEIASARFDEVLRRARALVHDTTT